MKPHWWGILGLIGWAYLVTSVVWLCFRRQIAGMVGEWKGAVKDLMPPRQPPQRAPAAPAAVEEPAAEREAAQVPESEAEDVRGISNTVKVDIEKLDAVMGIIGELNKGHMVLGVGVNLTAAPSIPDRAIPPASLAELGVERVPDRPVLAEEILSRWQDLESAPEPPFRWPEDGDEIRWEDGQGLCLGWAADGRLQVRTDHGVELLSVGDVKGLRA